MILPKELVENELKFILEIWLTRELVVNCSIKNQLKNYLLILSSHKLMMIQLTYLEVFVS
jgi:hypothetical protein